MFLSLQIKRDTFMAMLQDQIHRNVPVILSEFKGWLVDHLDVTSVTLEPDASATKVRIDVTAKLVKRTVVLNSGHLKSFSLFPVKLYVVAELTATPNQAGDVVITVTPVAVGEPGIEEPEEGFLDTKTEQELLANLSPETRELDLPTIAGIALKAHAAGLVAHADGVIALLVEISDPTPASPGVWKSFFAGDFTAHTGADWTALLPAELLVAAVDAALEDAVDAITQEPKVGLVSSPSTSWIDDSGPKSGPSGMPGFSTTSGGQIYILSKATINAEDACELKIFGKHITYLDIEIDLKFRVYFSLADGKVQVDVQFTWDADDTDKWECAAAAIADLGGIGALGAGLAFGPVAAAIVAIAALIVAFFNVGDEIANKMAEGAHDIDPGDLGLTVVKQTNDSIMIRGTVPVDMGLPGMQLTSVKATPEGLLLSGTLPVPDHQERSLELMGQTPFGWDARYSCSSKSWVEKRLPATVTFRDPAEVPVKVAVEILTEPIAFDGQMVQPYITDIDPGETAFTLKADTNWAPWEPLSADCELLIHTNSGIRYANFGSPPDPPEKPSSQELVKMSLNCFKLVAPGPKQWLEVQWLVDPPPYEPDFQRLQVWDITVVGVTPGDTVELGLLTGRGDPEVVAGLRADRRRGVAFRLNTVGLKHLAVSVDGTREETQVFAAGTFLEPILAIRRSGQRASTTVIGTGQAARIATALGGRVLVWDLERRLTGRIEIPGVRGVTAIAHGDLIAYTDTSVMRIGLTDGNVHVMTHRDLDSTITEVKDAAGTLVVRTEAKEEVVLDRTLVPINARAKRQDPAVTWNAEPWLSTPIRAGAVIARPLDGSVVIYRYLQPTVF